jgi:osmotically-inducible protein OsmY
MNIHRSLAALLLAASLSGGAFAQQPVLLDDEAIFVAVEEILHGTRSLDSARIDVSSRDGFVTLSGVAASIEDIATAGRLAARVRGVIGVSNEIRVEDRPSRA